MITYRKAHPENPPHILDFINMVFSMAHRPMISVSFSQNYVKKTKKKSLFTILL